MARLVSKTEARQVVERHEALMGAVRTIINGRNELKITISEDIRLVLREQMLEQLRGIPVEKLDFSKTSQRVGALKRHGLATLEDVYLMPQSQPESFGIGRYDASEIMSTVASVAEDILKEQRLDMASACRTEAFEKLINDLYVYAGIRDMAASCEYIVRRYSGSIELYIDCLQPAVSDTKWLLTPERGRQDALRAFDKLNELFTSDSYGAALDGFAGQLDALRNVSTDEAWREYSDNRSFFADIARSIAPEKILSDDTFGIAQDLIETVRMREIFTEELKCDLTETQKWGVRYIIDRGNAFLADRDRSSRMLQTIAAMASLRHSGGRHFIILCDEMAVSGWCEGVERFSVLKAYGLTGASSDAATNKWLHDGGVAVACMDSAADIALPFGFRVCMMAVDDAQFLYTSERRGSDVRRLGFCSDRLLFLSGTVTENDSEQLLPLIAMLRADVAGELENLTALKKRSEFKKTLSQVFLRRA